MNEHATPLIQQQPSSNGDERQTVIQFVLSGPILAGQSAPVSQPPAADGYSPLLSEPYAPPAGGGPLHETPPPATTFMPDPLPLSLVTEPASPALRAPDPQPPKVRGLRRMMAVLKNL